MTDDQAYRENPATGDGGQTPAERHVDQVDELVRNLQHMTKAMERQRDSSMRRAEANARIGFEQTFVVHYLATNPTENAVRAWDYAAEAWRCRPKHVREHWTAEALGLVKAED